MSDLYWLTDEQMTRLSPYFPKSHGRPRVDDRRVLTTPSLSYVWAALRSKLGIAVRTAHGVPEDMVCVDDRFGLPDLPPIEIRLLTSQTASSAAQDMCEILRGEANRLIAPAG